MNLKLYLLFGFVSICSAETLYEYYRSGGIKSGLIANGDQYYLNGRQITLFSGSFHYFRVHQNNWRQILLQMKASGLNAVDLYSPWHQHEPIPGQFDFKSGMLNLTDFLEAIKESDLFAMFRPGPYICAEVDFGGLPAWLLRDPNMKVRSTYKPYIDAVDRYWKQLFSITTQYEFSANGGPIIGVQIENEFGSYGNTVKSESDAKYMQTLGIIANTYGVNELLFTSDGPGKHGSIDQYFRAINFNKNAINNLKQQKALYPKQPLYVAEYWSGWFDNWGQPNRIAQNVSYYSELINQIVFEMNSSINIYMFIGGTNFGFNAGNVGKGNPGSLTAGVITSYDYDAPLTEAGNYTQKYWKTIELIDKFILERNLPKLDKPTSPIPNLSANYGLVNITEQLSLNQVLSQLKQYSYKNPVSMENINIGPNYGQNFGFTLYRTEIPISKTINFTKGRVNDRAAIVVDNRQIGFVFAKNQSFIQQIPRNAFNRRQQSKYTLDILVENMGRVFFGQTINDQLVQRKGLQEDVLIDDKLQTNWQIYALDMKTQFIDKLKSENWSPIANYTSPAFYRTKLTIEGKPKDTYIKLDDWTTSIVFINGFNLGRYWNVGPAKTLYVPSHILNTGINEIVIFETQSNGRYVEFVDRALIG